MFNKDFFPTPDNVIQELLQGVDFYNISILEPSAGKGDILDWILKRRVSRAGYRLDDTHYHERFYRGLYAIESNPELRHILAGKKYPLLDSDFLGYVPEQRFDLIVMNPPFSNGAAHLLKAMDIADGAEIRCLLNNQTTENAHTKERQVLAQRLMAAGATIKDLGACFKAAERTTSVEVVLITVPAKQRERLFEFHGNTYGEKQYKISDIANNQVATTNVFESLVHRYNKLKSIGQQIYQLLTEAEFYAEGLGANPIDSLQHTLNNRRHSEPMDTAYQRFVAEIKAQAWGSVFDQTKIAGMVTSKVRDDLESMQQAQGSMAFTTENLEGLLSTLFLNLGNIRAQCIAQAFDLLTNYHKDNREELEGWKTNDAWKVKPKVIIPYGANPAEKWFTSIGVSYSKQREFDDIEKALCFVTNKQFEQINSIRNLKPQQWGEWYETEFFMIKFFKKGTVHMKFKDLAVCRKFNIEACKGKNWLPSDYGKSSFDDDGKRAA